MDRITKKDKNSENYVNKYYIVEDIIGIPNTSINPISTHIEGDEFRAYGKPIDRLGKLEDLMEKYGINSIEELEQRLDSANEYDMELEERY